MTSDLLVIKKFFGMNNEQMKAEVMGGVDEDGNPKGLSKAARAKIAESIRALPAAQ